MNCYGKYVNLLVDRVKYDLKCIREDSSRDRLRTKTFEIIDGLSAPEDVKAALKDYYNSLIEQFAPPIVIPTAPARPRIKVSCL